MKYARLTNIRTTLAATLAVVLITLCFASCAQETTDEDTPDALQLTVTVSEDGDTTPYPQINATVGEYVTCRFECENVSSELQQALVIWAELPSYVQLLTDTALYYDAAHTTGYYVDNAITEGIQVKQCAGTSVDPNGNEIQGETIVLQCTLRIIAAPPEGENMVVPITGYVGNTITKEVYSNSASIVISSSPPADSSEADSTKTNDTENDDSETDDASSLVSPPNT